jgi:hypothetical protein
VTTTMPLAPDLAAKLAKVLGMLGSDHDGEVAAAGRRANALIKNAGLTWAQVIRPGGSRRCWRSLSPGADCAALCLLWPEALTDWEAAFCRSIAGRHRISPKQTDVLERIARKVEAVARAAGEE